MNLGVLLLDRGDSVSALAQFERAVGEDPASALAWYNLSRGLWESAVVDPRAGTADRLRTARAHEAIRRARELSPIDPRILLQAGRIAGALGLRDEARGALSEAAEVDRDGDLGREARRLLDLLETR
jgi:tetratricopeptide (TPR) repeat protein